ncbi:MAG: hypothetical protein QOD75_235 [Blastocatellia bacterium]|nr:hypothetical protein [Blastocatellia bacterium]
MLFQGKPLKRLAGQYPAQVTALKCGANENLKLTHYQVI